MIHFSILFVFFYLDMYLDILV